MLIPCQFVISFLTFIYVVNARCSEQTKDDSSPTVSPFSLSFMVAIFEIYNGKYYHVCDGVLISPKHILTVASCPTFKRNIYYHAVFALHNRSYILGKNEWPPKPMADDFVIPPEYPFKAANVKIHPEYAKNPEQNDIAIITLDNSIFAVTYNKNIKTACVSQITPEKTIFMAGWGQSSCNSMPSMLLTKAIGKIVDKSECQNTIKTGIKSTLSNSQLCLTFENANFYMGELGSPLYSRLGQENFQVLGLMSIKVPDGTDCYNKKVPFLHTRFDKHVSFILENAGESVFC